METKLTIRLKKKVVDRAKDYAQHHKTSLSRMVESYLESLTEEKTKTEEITPLVESLSGVIHIEGNNDDKLKYADFLTEKYK